MAEYAGILIAGEVADGKVSAVTRELFNIGRKLGDSLDQPVCSLLLGTDIKPAAEEAIPLGADKSYTVDGPTADKLHPDFYAQVLSLAVEQIKPSIVIMGHTDMGRDTAPRLAAKLGCPVTLDCIDLAIDTKNKAPIQMRPVYGGKAIAEFSSESKPQIVTMRPRAKMAAQPDSSRKGETMALDITVAETMVKGTLLETVKEPVKGISLEEAKVIVAGGSGIGSGEGFKMLEELAKMLGGTVGATRVPCDEGWVSFSLEIGQTGHVVTPNLYIAVAISGATQHIVGCSNSKHIVAINRDPDAPMFKMADFGVVGNYQEAVPALIEKIKTL